MVSWPTSAQAERQRPSVPRWLRGGLGMVAVVLGFVVVASQALVLVREAMAPAATSSDGLQLSDDDGASALFDVGGLRPGARGAGCITVSYAGAQGSSVVSLHGLTSGTGLDRSIDLTIEVGSGASFNDCSGFSGSLLYGGTLADFSANHRDVGTGLASFSTSGPAGAKSFRFSFGLRDDPVAQGRTAVATFTWQTRSSPGPGPITPPPTVPSDGPAPAPSDGPPAVTPAGAPVGLPSSRAPAQPAPAAAAPGPTTKGSTPSTTPGASTRRDLGGAEGATPAPESAPAGPEEEAQGGDAPVRTVPLTPNGRGPAPSALQTLSRLAVAAAKTTAFPLALLIMVVVFLVVQDRIDRRDPKLALAPVRSADLSFGSPED